ncbi:MAG TPA: hypothetical protein VFT55_10345 [Planctomycetota bacterium]|nr:hypothetical protein [Planctomycetota bacterium]
MLPFRQRGFTSAPWFDGFRERVTVRGLDTIGWRRHGLLSVHELPATG